MEQVSNNSKGPFGSFMVTAKKIADAKSPKTTPQNTIFEQDGTGFVARNDDGLVVERYIVHRDGKVVDHQKYEYNKNGNMIRVLEDYKGGGADGKHPDGVADCVCTYEYDENMIRRLEDNKGGGADGRQPDGVVDCVYTYEYDENGNMIRELDDHSGGGADGKHPDGVAEFVTYYIRNEKGELTHQGYDEDGNGVIDRFHER